MAVSKSEEKLMSQALPMSSQVLNSSAFSFSVLLHFHNRVALRFVTVGCSTRLGGCGKQGEPDRRTFLLQCSFWRVLPMQLEIVRNSLWHSAFNQLRIVNSQELISLATGQCSTCACMYACLVCVYVCEYACVTVPLCDCACVRECLWVCVFVCVVGNWI